MVATVSNVRHVHPPVSPAEQRVRDDMMAELNEFLTGRDLVLVTNVLRLVNQALREAEAEREAEQIRVH